MNQTRISLLRRAADGSSEAWDALVKLYQPMVAGWLTRQGVAQQDAAELTQDVMLVLVQRIAEFDHSGRTGAFRSWLRTITVNRAREFWRRGRLRPNSPGGKAFTELIHQVHDEKSDLAVSWNAEHDSYILRSLFQSIASEFEDSTLTAFRRTTIEEAAATDVAAELDITVGAVYTARSRVLRRLRELAEGIIDDSLIE